ncbi:hypothetical protein L6452_41406 [Arctium lappa]|uniref:Uncharacterized protein n=1 Tax=Arctium lappa TaxID=4217 RepID=A0ACB8XNE1_ARCLA|nr:hypothetical protein L6452_41406 [Arctium lappa]
MDGCHLNWFAFLGFNPSDHFKGLNSMQAQVTMISHKLQGISFCNPDCKKRMFSKVNFMNGGADLAGLF